MSLPDVLTVLAELAIGMAGFGGVASAFSGRERKFSPAELIRLQSLLLGSSSVVVGCLGFFVSAVSGLSDANATIVAAICSLPITIYFACTVVPEAWRLVFDPNATTSAGVVSIFSLMTAGILVSHGGVLLLSGSPPLLIFGFSLQLVLGLWVFARLLTRPN